MRISGLCLKLGQDIPIFLLYSNPGVPFSSPAPEDTVFVRDIRYPRDAKLFSVSSTNKDLLHNYRPAVASCLSFFSFDPPAIKVYVHRSLEVRTLLTLDDCLLQFNPKQMHGQLNRVCHDIRCIFSRVGDGKYRTLASRSKGNTKSTSWLLNHEALTELD